MTPFMTSPRGFVKQALGLLKLSPSDVFLDVGAGDGAVLEAALEGLESVRY